MTPVSELEGLRRASVARAFNFLALESRLHDQFLRRQDRGHPLVLITSFAREVHSAMTRRALLRAGATDVNNVVSGSRI